MPRYRYSWDHDRPNRPAHRVTDTIKTKPSESVRKQLARDINIDVTQRGDLAPRCRHAPNPVGRVQAIAARFFAERRSARAWIVTKGREGLFFSQ